MSELLNLQSAFQCYLLNDAIDLDKFIVSPDETFLAARLGIYKNAYRSRLTESLAANYPMLSRYLGSDHFTKIADEYIDEYPSTCRSIRWYGDHLAVFLAAHPRYKAFGYLAELSQLEWCMTLVFDAVDCEPLQSETIALVPPENWADMRLTVHPSVHRLDFTWNVVQIWQAVMNEKKPDEPFQLEMKVPWILWRKELTNQFCSLKKEEAWGLDAVIRQCTFGEICEGLCQWINEEEVGMVAAQLLKNWLEAGLLKEIIFNEKSR